MRLVPNNVFKGSIESLLVNRQLSSMRQKLLQQRVLKAVLASIREEVMIQYLQVAHSGRLYLQQSSWINLGAYHVTSCACGLKGCGHKSTSLTGSTLLQADTSSVARREFRMTYTQSTAPPEMRQEVESSSCLVP
eukprot:4909279-Amphidinium_carterae.1